MIYLFTGSQVYVLFWHRFPALTHQTIGAGEELFSDFILSHIRPLYSRTNKMQTGAWISMLSLFFIQMINVAALPNQQQGKYSFCFLLVKISKTWRYLETFLDVKLLIVLNQKCKEIQSTPVVVTRYRF